MEHFQRDDRRFRDVPSQAVKPWSTVKTGHRPVIRNGTDVGVVSIADSQPINNPNPKP